MPHGFLVIVSPCCRGFQHPACQSERLSRCWRGLPAAVCHPVLTRSSALSDRCHSGTAPRWRTEQHSGAAGRLSSCWRGSLSGRTPRWRMMLTRTSRSHRPSPAVAVAGTAQPARRGSTTHALTHPTSNPYGNRPRLSLSRPEPEQVTRTESRAGCAHSCERPDTR